MPSTPLTCCSIGRATVSATVRAPALKGVVRQSLDLRRAPVPEGCGDLHPALGGGIVDGPRQGRRPLVGGLGRGLRDQKRRRAPLRRPHADEIAWQQLEFWILQN